MEEELLSLLTVVWESECIPSDWRCAIIVAVFKKGDRRLCANHRGVSLLSVAGKVFIRALLSRLHEQIEPSILEEQCGFHSGRSITDRIFTLKLVVDRCWEYRVPLYLFR